MLNVSLVPPDHFLLSHHVYLELLNQTFLSLNDVMHCIQGLHGFLLVLRLGDV